MKKIFILIIFILFVSCGDDSDDYNSDEYCHGVKIDHYKVCDDYSAMYKDCSDYGNYDSGYMGCKEDCSDWDYSDCSKCGDGDTTGSEVCDGDVKSCAFAGGGDYFESGAAYCRSSCNGWNMKECIYKICPNGGVPSDAWRDISGKSVCMCSPYCETDDDCNKDKNEICSPYLYDIYSNYNIKSCVVYDEETGDGNVSDEAYKCVEE